MSPVRPRRARQAVRKLTMDRHMALMLGPRVGDPAAESLEVLREVYREHWESFPEDSWAYQFFGAEAVDGRADAGGALEVQRGRSGHELDVAVDLPGAWDPTRRG